MKNLKVRETIELSASEAFKLVEKDLGLSDCKIEMFYVEGEPEEQLKNYSFVTFKLEDGGYRIVVVLENIKNACANFEAVTFISAMIHSMVHEYRHVYQYKNNLYTEEFKSCNVLSNRQQYDANYNTIAYEQDAESYAINVTNLFQFSLAVVEVMKHAEIIENKDWLDVNRLYYELINNSIFMSELFNVFPQGISMLPTVKNAYSDTAVYINTITLKERNTVVDLCNVIAELITKNHTIAYSNEFASVLGTICTNQL